MIITIYDEVLFLIFSMYFINFLTRQCNKLNGWYIFHIYLYCHRSKLGFIFLLYNYDHQACIIYLLYVFEQVKRKLKCNSFKVVTKNAFVTFKIKYLQHNKIVEKIIYNIIYNYSIFLLSYLNNF